MNFTILNTLDIYRRMLAERDTVARTTMFESEIAAPFAPMLRIFGSEGTPAFKQFNMVTADDLENGVSAVIRAQVERLIEVGAHALTTAALNEAAERFAPFADRLHVQDVIYALLLMHPDKLMPGDLGYAGFGGIPGYIMVTLSSTSDAVIGLLKGTTAHELYHNVHFSVQPFSIMSATVGQYLTVEGLAESFAHELYGEAGVGLHAKAFDESRMDEMRGIFGQALNVTGFDVVRGYIFGGRIAAHMNLPAIDLPDFAGYGMGYRVVQAYLKRSGRSAAESVFMPWQEIVSGSGIFDPR